MSTTFGVITPSESQSAEREKVSQRNTLTGPGILQYYTLSLALVSAKQRLHFFDIEELVVNQDLLGCEILVVVVLDLHDHILLRRCALDEVADLLLWRDEISENLIRAYDKTDLCMI